MYRFILNSAFNSISNNLNTLTKALLLPTLLLIGLEFIKDMTITYIVLSLLISIIISITVHRISLLGSESINPWGHFDFSKREISFILNLFLIILIIALASFVAGFIHTILLGAVLLVLSLFYLPRIVLVFPAISTDNPLNMRQALHLSRNHKFLCFVNVIIIPTVFTVTVGTVYVLILQFLAGIISPYVLFLAPILTVVLNVVTITILSFTYSVLVQIQDEETQAKLIPNEIKIEENTITIHNLHPVSFESLKEELLHFYEDLGLTQVVLDKENSWMLKNPHINEAYVLLSMKEDNFIIEVYNTVHPKLDILEQQK
jgi:hypothetical protein